MRIVFTADQHINVRKAKVPKEWAISRYLQYFNKLKEIEHDILICGGDFFDKSPNIIEIGLFLEFIRNHNKPIYIIAGNHEATTKYGTFLEELKKLKLNHVYIITDSQTMVFPEFSRFAKEVAITFMSYSEIKANNEPPKSLDHKLNILVSHARGKLPFIDAEYDFKKFKDYDLVLLGDLHFYHNHKPFNNVWYPGSPYSINFEQNNLEKDWGVLLINSETVIPEFIRLDLPQLVKEVVEPSNIQKRLTEVSKSAHCFLLEVEGNVEDLTNIPKGTVQKKIKVTNKATIDLIGKSKEEEMVAVLTYMKIKDISYIMEIYNATT